MRTQQHLESTYFH